MIGLRLKDGIVLAVEKLVTSKLLVPGSNRRIVTVDHHAAVVCPSYPLDRLVANSLLMTGDWSLAGDGWLAR